MATWFTQFIDEEYKRLNEESLLDKAIDKIETFADYIRKTDQKSDKLKKLVIGFAAAGAVLFYGGTIYLDNALHKEWQAAYSQMQNNNPKEAQQIKVLMDRYKKLGAIKVRMGDSKSGQYFNALKDGAEQAKIRKEIKSIIDTARNSAKERQ